MSQPHGIGSRSSSLSNLLDCFVNFREEKKMNAKRIVWIVLTLLALTVWVGCASAPTEVPKPTTAPAVPTTAPAAQPTTAPAAKPTTAPAASGPSGSIVFALGGEPPTLDSQREDLLGMRYITDQIFEYLVYPNKQTLEMEPALALSWTQVDPTTLRMKLRQGVKFHNGEDFNSKSVAASVARILDPETQTQLKSTISTITEAKPVDDYTVDIKTSTSDPILLKRLVWITMVPAEASKDRNTFQSKPIGTGPYKFVEWVKGQRVVLTANENYWGEKPSIKDVTYRFIPEAATRLAALKAGEVDVFPVLLPEYVKEVPKLAKAQGLNFMWFRINTLRPPTDDLRVRQAIQYAVDRESIIKNIFGGLAQLPQGQIITQAHFGFNPNLKPWPFDPAKAKQLIADYGKPVSIEMVAESSGYYPHSREFTEAVASNLRDVGIQVKVNYLEIAEEQKAFFITPQEDPKSKLHLVESRHNNTLFDPDRTLSNQVLTGAGQSLISDPAMDKLINDARSEMDAAKRAKMYQDVFQKVYDQAWSLPLLIYDELYGLSTRVDWTPRLDQRVNLKEFKLTK
jgi:peptide/nickel transport system substrate-binding protein